MSNYTIMHLHSMLSNGVTNIDSVTNYQDYVDRAKECGMDAICFTEHGCIFEWLKKKEAVEKAGMKYIHGVEAYITESLDEKKRDNYHCVLIARNYEGFLELNTLVSKSFNRAEVKTVGDTVQYYYTPRLTFSELINTSDNIIVSTACLASILSKGSPELREKFICFLAAHKNRCFLEIQHHNVQDQIDYNKFLYELHKTINVPLITGTDTHALNDLHLKGRAILQKSKKVHFENEDSWDLTFKTYDELIAAYEKQGSLPIDVVKEAIENTNVLASMVEPFEVDRSYKYPHLWNDSMGLFRQKINDGIKRRGVDKYPNYQEYLDRIEHEIKAYVHNEAIDFMLLTEDIISWCRANDITVGYGRGSVNGSVIAWLLGITEMDSIKHHLNFERFMNVERVSLSDVDTDFPPSRIEDVKQYIFSRHGLHCSDIITFNTIADKGAIRDVGRALDIPLSEVNKICDAVDNEEEYEKVKKQYTELFEYVDIVKGVVVSIGSHPCGVIVSPETLEDHIGLCTTSTDNYPISQLYMKEVDSLNYVKLDLLKLDTIELIDKTCKLAGIDLVTPDNVDINDDKVWNAIRDDTTQIFQWESASAEAYIKRLLSDENIKKFQAIDENVDKMTLLSIGNSAIRPAGASYRDDLSNGIIRTTGSKPIDDFLSNTFGYLVFQCQIIEFLHQYCGFTMGEADIVRRGFAKKTGTDQYIPIIKNGGCINQKTQHHIDGFIKTMKNKYGIDEKKSEEDIASFIKVIEDASSYLFSLNHSQPYSYEGYVCGWLRTYYPLEFLTVAMNINSGKEEKTIALTKYAKKIGIRFQPPKFRHSEGDYSCDKETNTIYKGLSSIKFLGGEIADQLHTLGQNKYTSFASLLFDIKEKTNMDSRQLDILIKIDFFSEFGDINKLLHTVERFNQIYGKRSIKKDVAEKNKLPEDAIRKFADEESDTRITEIDIDKFLEDRGLSVSDLQDCIKYRYETAENGTKTKVENGHSFEKIFKKYELTEDEKMKYATKIVYGKFDHIYSKGLLKYIEKNENVKPCSLSQKLKYQLELLGYIDYVDQALDKNLMVITGLDTTYSPKFSGYRLNDGKSADLRVHKSRNPKDKSVKTSFRDVPFENGDIILVKKYEKKPRVKKGQDGSWVEIPGEYHWWLTDYELTNI